MPPVFFLDCLFQFASESHLSWRGTRQRLLQGFELFFGEFRCGVSAGSGHLVIDSAILLRSRGDASGGENAESLAGDLGWIAK